MKSNVVIYPQAIQMLCHAQVVALEQTVEALHTEVVQAQVMPRDSGHLQNDSTFVDCSRAKSGKVSLISQTPYARRLYFHPEYHFQKTENAAAQGKWLEPWISGSEKDFCRETYSTFFKRLGGV